MKDPIAFLCVAFASAFIFYAVAVPAIPLPNETSAVPVVVQLIVLLGPPLVLLTVALALRVTSGLLGPLIKALYLALACLAIPYAALAAVSFGACLWYGNC